MINDHAVIKLVGNLGHSDFGDGHNANRVKEVLVTTPIRIGDALRKIEEDYGVSLPRDSVLILVNGTEANALEDLDTMIRADDTIVLVPMFHGG